MFYTVSAIGHNAGIEDWSLDFPHSLMPTIYEHSEARFKRLLSLLGNSTFVSSDLPDAGPSLS
jgi:hypothetical protein